MGSDLPKVIRFTIERDICIVGMNISLHLEIINSFNLEIKIAQMLKEKSNEILYYLLRCLGKILDK